MSTAKPLLAEESKIVLSNLALLNSAAFTGDYVSLKNYESVEIIVGLAPASGTDTAAITLKQASDVAATGEKALAFSPAFMHFNGAPGTSDALVRTAVVSDSITTSALAALELYVIHVDAASLDVANGFDCVRVHVTDPGSVSTPSFVLYILRHCRYAQATPPSAILD